MQKLLHRHEGNKMEEAAKLYDILIIGGGPAGLACAQYSARAGRKTAVLEELSTGGQTMLIDEIENYPGLERLSGYEISAKFENQAIVFGAEIIYASVSSILKAEDGMFEVTTSEGNFTAPVVVLATGAGHRTLEVPGEKEYTGHGVSYCATCDGPFFRNRKILVCGGGDSACQEAVFLSKLSDKVTICHRRDSFRAQASIVKNLEDAGIRKLMNTTVRSINGKDGKVCSVTLISKEDNSTYTEDFDGVFIFTGMIPRTDLVPFCEKDSAGYIVTDSTMATSVPGLYAIGDVRNTPFRQIVTAAADGAIAAHCASEYIENL